MEFSQNLRNKNSIELFLMVVLNGKNNWFLMSYSNFVRLHKMQSSFLNKYNIAIISPKRENSKRY